MNNFISITDFMQNELIYITFEAVVLEHKEYILTFKILLFVIFTLYSIITM